MEDQLSRPICGVRINIANRALSKAVGIRKVVLRTFLNELDSVKESLDNSKSNLNIVDYSSVRKRIANISLRLKP